MHQDVNRRHGLGYFPAVDGLRAVAVLAVILFHLRDTIVPGGYAGVDIFFVVSGFVVTASLADVSFDRFRDLLAHFYARRLVRIMPALIVCLLVTFSVFALFIPRTWLSNLSEETGVAAFLGLSNVILARNEDNYFAATADFNPYLHTWSLGVEEQFYLIFPLLMFLYAKSRSRSKMRRATIGIIVSAGLVSFALCGVLAAIRWEYSFYLLPARFWQLALGMTLALTYRTWQPKAASLGPGVGNVGALVWVALAAVSFSLPSSPRFPFPLALIPTLAAGLAIILCAARPEDRSSRILASAPVLWVGLRSYSLYLWHWPVIVTMRWTTGLDSPALLMVAVVISLALGAASYRFVEQPFRQAPKLKGAPRGRIALGGVAVALVGWIFGQGIASVQPSVSFSRTANIDEWQARRDSPLLPGPAGCNLTQANRRIHGGAVDHWRRRGCSQQSGTVYTIGNSHAQGYAPMLRQFTLDTGRDTVLYYKTGCAFLPLNEALLNKGSCRQYFAQVMRELTAELAPGDVVFLASLRIRPPIDQWGARVAQTSEEQGRAAMDEARSILQRLTKSGATIIFEAPKPVLGAPVFRCADPYTRVNPICASGLFVDRDAMLEMRRPVMERMSKLETEFKGVRVWDPLPTLCPGETCSGFDGVKPILFDMHHLSNHGNRMLRDSFRESVQPLMETGPQAAERLP